MANTIDCYDQIGSTSECSDIKFKVALGVGREILRRRGLEINAHMLTQDARSTELFSGLLTHPQSKVGQPAPLPFMQLL